MIKSALEDVKTVPATSEFSMSKFFQDAYDHGVVSAISEHPKEATVTAAAAALALTVGVKAVVGALSKESEFANVRSYAELRAQSAGYRPEFDLVPSSLSEQTFGNKAFTSTDSANLKKLFDDRERFLKEPNLISSVSPVHWKAGA